MCTIKTNILFCIKLLLAIIIAWLAIFFITRRAVIENYTKLTRQYVAYLATQIKNSDVEYDLSEIDEHTLFLDTIFNGYIFLLDKYGFVITHPNNEYVAANAEDRINIIDIYDRTFDFDSIKENYFNDTDYDGVSRLFIPYNLEGSDRIIYLAIPMSLITGISDGAALFLSILLTVIIILILRYISISRLHYSKELMQQTQRLYLKAVENINTVFFEYDVKEKQAMHSGKLFPKHGIVSVMYNVPQSILDLDIIHKDDADSFCTMIERIDNGADTSESTIRMNDLEGNEFWYNIVMTNSFDKMGAPVRAVAVVRDITADKHDKILWQNKAERDAMTGIYNKVSGMEFIKDILEESTEDDIHALFIIDADNFKNVNDTLGHAEGDKIIIDFAQILTNIFRDTDIVCRFGGDEFIVFSKNISSKTVICKRAEEICESLRNKYTKGDDAINVSSSVGIACFPYHGKTYEELFRHADVALYETKENGRDSYTIYKPNMIDK